MNDNLEQVQGITRVLVTKSVELHYHIEPQKGVVSIFLGKTILPANAGTEYNAEIWYSSDTIVKLVLPSKGDAPYDNEACDSAATFGMTTDPFEIVEDVLNALAFFREMYGITLDRWELARLDVREFLGLKSEPELN